MYLITGGSRGIGRALAQALAERGKDVIIVGRSEIEMQATVKLYPSIQWIKADLTDESSFNALVSRLIVLGSLKGLIHNAGLIDPLISLAQLSKASFRQIMTTNLEVPLFLSQALLPNLKAGRVLHIGSGAAYFATQSWGGYCVSKAALAMLTRCWQEDCHDPVFASVMPGIVETQMQERIRASQNLSEEKQAFFAALKANHQLVMPETVAAFLTWLLLDIDDRRFGSEEWDIYDKTHHPEWLKAPHQVPDWF